MSGDLLGRCVCVDEQLGGAEVPQLALARQDVAVHRGGDERMNEAQRQPG
jgi:hypothetical protein